MVIGYLNAMDEYLEKRGLWKEALSWTEQGIVASRLLEDDTLMGGLLNDLGLCYRHLGQFEKARHYFEQSLDLRQKVGPLAGKAVTLNNLGLVHDDLGQRHQALQFYE